MGRRHTHGGAVRPLLGQSLHERSAVGRPRRGAIPELVPLGRCHRSGALQKASQDVPGAPSKHPLTRVDRLGEVSTTSPLSVDALLLLRDGRGQQRQPSAWLTCWLVHLRRSAYSPFARWRRGALTWPLPQRCWAKQTRVTVDVERGDRLDGDTVSGGTWIEPASAPFWSMTCWLGRTATTHGTVLDDCDLCGIRPAQSSVLPHPRAVSPDSWPADLVPNYALPETCRAPPWHPGVSMAHGDQRVA